MTASVITKLAPVLEDRVLGKTPYALEVKGKPEPRVTIAELLDPDTGARTVRITALANDGKPVQALPTLDQVARRILPNARVTSYNKAATGVRITREYATA
jgi:hypothetical protein